MGGGGLGSNKVHSPSVTILLSIELLVNVIQVEEV